jgi:hypothetical protein
VKIPSAVYKAARSAVSRLDGADPVVLEQQQGASLARDVQSAVPGTTEAVAREALALALAAVSEARGAGLGAFIATREQAPADQPAGQQYRGLNLLIAQKLSTPEGEAAVGGARRRLEDAIGQSVASLRPSDLAAAHQLVAELDSPAVSAALDKVATGIVRREVEALSTLSQAIGAMPRAADGRATDALNRRYAAEITPRVDALLDYEEVSGRSLRQMLVDAPPAAPAKISASARKAIASLDKQLKAPASRGLEAEVATREDAEMVLAHFAQKAADAGAPLLDTGAMWPRLIKDLVGKDKSFHWDDEFEARGDPPVDVLKGHYWAPDREGGQTKAEYQHATRPHLQMDLGGRLEVRVYMPRPRGLQDPPPFKGAS